MLSNQQNCMEITNDSSSYKGNITDLLVIIVPADALARQLPGLLLIQWWPSSGPVNIQDQHSKLLSKLGILESFF